MGRGHIKKLKELPKRASDGATATGLL